MLVLPKDWCKSNKILPSSKLKLGLNSKGLFIEKFPIRKFPRRRKCKKK
jgi:hypothetical protein